ncbi:hypothetical protein BCD49_03905 [Pseudofrankia sp. EUN1h]|nr:hypothetical protein BCD49_03905 [Pseudofrankia sp. EUN1h]
MSAGRPDRLAAIASTRIGAATTSRARRGGRPGFQLGPVPTACVGISGMGGEDPGRAAAAGPAGAEDAAFPRAGGAGSPPAARAPPE